MKKFGVLPVELNVKPEKMSNGDIIDIYPYKGVCKNHETGEELCKFKSHVIFDELQASDSIQYGLTPAASY